MTSDEPRFHRFVESFVDAVRSMAQRSGEYVSLRHANTVLLVMKAQNVAELWIDTGAVSLLVRTKRAIKAHTAVFESDIADITGMTFPCVEFADDDKVFCLFRLDWRFGFAFDVNPKGQFDRDGFSSTLGSLYRVMRYRHLYDAMQDSSTFSRLVGAGWFPFAELIATEFKELIHHCEVGLDIADVEERILRDFDASRLQFLRERWVAKAHFAARISLLDEAICAFLARRPVAVIKILLTEIEGILNDAYRAMHEGRGAPIKELLTFAEASGEQNAGAPDTLLFTRAFGRYLRQHTFESFDPTGKRGRASSRHAVGHGAASAESYTMVRALQAILVVDQLAFFT